jgi:glycosyltransferase involved in cell wall biosynthesis
MPFWTRSAWEPNHRVAAAQGSHAAVTQVDVIVPVRNEAASVPKFLAAVESLALPAEVELKVVFIEDGSTDNTVAMLRNLARENPRIQYFSMANGFGEGPAIMFGLRRSRADAIIMMAVESHPPELIPLMIQAFREGAEVVQCVRDSFAGRQRYRDVATALFVPFIRFLTGFDYGQQNVYYRLMSRAFANQVLASPRYQRFLRFPLPDEASGALRIIHADMAERESGKSQYSLGRLMGLALDGILACISAPRMVVLNVVLLLIAATLFWLNLSPLASLFVAGPLFLCYRYFWLRTVDHMQKLIIRECSDDTGRGSGS